MQTEMANVHALIAALSDRVAELERRVGVTSPQDAVRHDIGSDLASIETSLESVMASLDEPDPMPSIVHLNESRASRGSVLRERPAGWQPVESRRSGS